MTEEMRRAWDAHHQLIAQQSVAAMDREERRAMEYVRQLSQIRALREAAERNRQTQ